jgi:DNA helicase-2/ATP-dependent DNA helicase PcrA
VQTAVQIANTLGISLFEVFQTADSYAPLSRKAGPLAAFAGMLSELAREAESLPLPDLLDRLLEQSGYLAALREDHDAGPARLENIEELKSNMLRYQEESEEPTLAGFLEEIALYTDLDSYDPQADSMVLMTIHAAKGLEFEHVFVAGLEEGIFPGYQATGDMTQLEEERRLAYVAMTRARQRLYLLSAEQRVLFGQTSRNRLSRFVTEIPAELLLETAASSRFPAQAAKTPGAGTAGRCAGPISKTGAFDSPAPCELRPGDRVGHRVFGEGMVLSLSPMGGDTLVEVAFDRVGTKRMMANYARLKKM